MRLASVDHAGPGALLLGRLGAQVGATTGLSSLAWLARSAAGDWRTVAAVGEVAVGGAEAPDGLAWDLLPRLAEIDSLRLGAGELRARPELWGRGVREALLVRAGDSRALWVDLHAPGVLDEPHARELARELAELEVAEHGTARERPEPGVRELAARAASALGTQHDLRNQLSLALLELERLDSEDGGGLSGLRQALQRARDLARAPLEAAGAVERRRPLPLRELLQEELAAAAALAGSDGGVGLALRCSPRATVNAAELELRRWVANAVLNALRATHPGKRVRVMGEVLATGRARIVVEDEGRGMDADEAGRLFRPGESASGGTGFGSASLLACARALGAELLVESAPGVGTRLTLELPAIPGPES